MAGKWRSWAALAGVAAGIFSLVLWGSPQVADSYDLRTWHCAYRAFAAGENPYDARALFRCQAALGNTIPGAPAVYYGPWFFILFAPVMRWPYPVAGALLFTAQLFCALLTARIVWRLAGGAKERFGVAITAALLFYPNLQTLAWQQMGLLFTLSASAFLWLERRGRDAAAGAVLWPLTLKPHLFLVLIPAAAYWVCRERRWKIPLALAAAVLATAGVAEWYSPGLTGHYLDTIRQPPLEFQSPTLAGLLRTLLQTGAGGPPAWPVWAVPLAGMAGVAAWLAWRRPRVEWLETSWVLLPLALILAPYGHPHDYALLAVPVLYVLARAFGDRGSARARRVAAGTLFGLQAASFAADALWLDSGWQFFWFPPAVLGAAWLSLRTLGEAGRDE
jgi:hypothetical protein